MEMEMEMEDSDHRGFYGSFIAIISQWVIQVSYRECERVTSKREMVTLSPAIPYTVLVFID